jgi:exodeoxyribonuclease VII small subunit
MAGGFEMTTFEDRLRRLEEIVGELEGDDLPLARALALFEEGVAQLREATGELSEAEMRVQKLVEESDGAFRLEDVDG